MKFSTHLRVLPVAAALLVGMSANAAGVLGSTAVGSLIFGTSPDNYFDPSNGFVPPGYSNTTSNSVVLAEPALDFGFNDNVNLDVANFTNTQVSISDTSFYVGTNSPWTMTFTDVAFTGISLVSSSFAPGLTYGIIGDTLVFSYAGGDSVPGTQTAVFNLNGATAAVPEPQTYALLVAGLMTVGFAARRRSGR
jgi:hypothetical protein